MYFRGIHLLRLHLRRWGDEGSPSKCERMQSWKGEGVVISIQMFSCKFF